MRVQCSTLRVHNCSCGSKARIHSKNEGEWGENIKSHSFPLKSYEFHLVYSSILTTSIGPIAFHIYLKNKKERRYKKPEQNIKWNGGLSGGAIGRIQL